MSTDSSGESEGKRDKGTVLRMVVASLRCSNADTNVWGFVTLSLVLERTKRVSMDRVRKSWHIEAVRSCNKGVLVKRESLS